MDAFECLACDFEFYPMSDWKPMQRFKNRSDVMLLFGFSDGSGSIILDELKSTNGFVG